MQDTLNYRERAARLRDFLAEDEVFGLGVSARRRLSVVNRAVRVVEADIARIDPLFAEARSRYLDALFRAKPKSRWLRTIVGSVIRDVRQTHGADSPLLTALQSIRTLAWKEVRKANESKITQAEQHVDELRNGSETDRRKTIGAMYKLAEVYRRAGSYAFMIRIYDELAAARTELVVDETHLAAVERHTAEIYYEHGEVDRAARLMETFYRRDSNRKREIGIELDDLIEDTYLQLVMGQAYLVSGQAEAAEAVLRESLDRLERHEDKLHNKHVYKQRHRVNYELGSALWHQDRAQEAARYFGEAQQLVAGPRLVDEQVAPIYFNAIAFSQM